MTKMETDVWTDRKWDTLSKWVFGYFIYLYYVFTSVTSANERLDLTLIFIVSAPTNDFCWDNIFMFSALLVVKFKNLNNKLQKPSEQHAHYAVFHHSASDIWISSNSMMFVQHLSPDVDVFLLLYTNRLLKLVLFNNCKMCRRLQTARKTQLYYLFWYPEIL